MKNKLLFLLIFIVLLVLSCTKNDDLLQISTTKWRVVKVKEQSESSYTKADKDYIIDFVNDTLYTLSLDVNNCSGNYETINNGAVNINLPGCTKMCCDSNFAEELLQLLPKMTTYSQKRKQLILEGQGIIVLEQY